MQPMTHCMCVCVCVCARAMRTPTLSASAPAVPPIRGVACCKCCNAVGLNSNPWPDPSPGEPARPPASPASSDAPVGPAPGGDGKGLMNCGIELRLMRLPGLMSAGGCVDTHTHTHTHTHMHGWSTLPGLI